MNPTAKEERNKAISIYHLILRHERGFGAGSGEIARLQFKNRANAISPIIVGSFDRRAPVGRPANWRFVPPLRKPAQLELAGKYLLAVTLPLFPKVSDMVCFRPQQIGSVQAKGTGAALEIEMRAPTIFDPPITLAIPALLCRRHRRRAARAGLSAQIDDNDHLAFRRRRSGLWPGSEEGRIRVEAGPGQMQNRSAMQGSSLTSRRDLVTGIEAIHARFSGHAYDMHTHDDEWLVGVTHAGVQDFFCRGSRRQSTRGKVILIEPGERHDGRAVEAGGFSYSMLYLPAPWVRHALGSDAGIGFRQTLAEDDRLGQAIVATCRAMLKGGGALQIEELRDRVLGRLRQHLGAAPARADRPDLGLAARAMAYLQAHFDTDLTSADLVQATGADSRFQLARAFQARYGTSPHACLVEIRLARARALLRAGQAPAEAAAACGFADQSHMTRWFRRAYGIAPGAWQRGRTIVQDHA